MTTQSSNVLLVLANAVANFNGSMSYVRSAANILVSNLGINGFTTQIMGILVPFKKSLIDLGFNAELVNDFMSSLGVICDCKDKAIGKYTKQHIATIKSFLELANQKQVVTEKAAHDAEIAVIAQHPILAELDNCLNAQIAASRTPVAVANNCKEFANVENAAAEEGVELAGYFDLYSDAGWELDFDPMQLEQIQSIYAAAKEQDGDDDDKTSADELVEQFAKFIHKQLFEKRNAFDKLIDSSDCEVSLFAYDLMINKSTKILLQVKGSGNVCLKHLCSGNNNGSVCSVSFCIHQCQFFKTFYCFKMETFFKDILQDNL